MSSKIATQCYWYDKETNDPPYCRLRRDYIEDLGGCTYCCMDRNAVEDIVRGLSLLMVDKVGMVAKIYSGLDEFDKVRK